MASYQIVQQMPQPGFLQGLGSGIQKGGDSLTSLILPALFKQKMAEKEAGAIDERTKAAQDAMDQGGYDIDSVEIGPDGKPKYKYKKKEQPETMQETFKKDPAKTIKEAILGIQSPEDLGGILGIPKPAPMDPTIAASAFPVGSMTGQAPENATGKGYGNIVQDALREKYAGGADQASIGRDYLGLPQAPKPPAEPKLSDSMAFNEAVKGATSGKSTWDDLRGLFPTKIDDIQTLQNQFTPVEKSPEFTAGTGSPVSHIKSFFKGNQAEISDATQAVIGNIKSKADLDELRINAKAYEEAGVDVKAILEYYGIKGI